MAKLAVSNGANIIKHQTHIIEDEMSIEASSCKTGYLDETIYDTMKNCLTLEEEKEFKIFVENELHSIYLSTPFSRKAADFLMEIDVPCFKIGSGECNNIPLLKHIASFGKPIILSTGMNNINSIRESLESIKSSKVEIILMHTTNSYPCPDEFIKLQCITELKSAFPNIIIGYSDHSEGEFASYGAVALGKVIIGKHFTDSFNRIGPDISCSMDPEMCRKIATNIRRIFHMNKSGKSLTSIEQKVANFAFASVCAIKNLQEGDFLSEDNIWVKRPGNGDFP